MQVLLYTAARLGVFLALFGVFAWAGAAAWFAAVLAFVAAWPLSAVMLPALRARAVAELDGALSRRRVPGAEDAAAEDSGD